MLMKFTPVRRETDRAELSKKLFQFVKCSHATDHKKVKVEHSLLFMFSPPKVS